MKVGIYNQFLLTMGGGERHMGMAAEVLARAGHDVEIVTHVPASIDALAARFDLDLPGVRLRTTPLLPFDQLGDLTSEYDLWVNASFMSMVPSRARRSLLLVLFPMPMLLLLAGRGYGSLLPRTRRSSIPIVAWLDGRTRAKTRTSRFAALAPVYNIP